MKIEIFSVLKDDRCAPCNPPSKTVGKILGNEAIWIQSLPQGRLRFCIGKNKQ